MHLLTQSGAEGTDYKAPTRNAPTVKAPTEKAPTVKAPTEKAPTEKALITIAQWFRMN